MAPYKGIGEFPTVAAPVAIVNAVCETLAGTQVRHLDAPLTPEKVWSGGHGTPAHAAGRRRLPRCGRTRPGLDGS